MSDAFIILTGPTGVGKTALSLELAEQLGAEIVSADSRQIYRSLDIGTAKPSPAELQRVRHHFIDELPIDAPYTAGRFGQDAHARIDDIVSRGRIPLVVGGSTLYIHALKHGLANVPDVPSTVRATLEDELKHHGPERLFAELRKVDPRAAETMDPTKTQRLIRALEVHRSTGRPLSEFHAEQEEARPPHRFKTYVLNRPREALYRRINERVDDMFARGLLDEVRGLLAHGFGPGLNPLRTIGYQEPIRFLQGEIAREEMVRLVKRNSRRYAKRQLTWFRRDDDNVWLDAAAPIDELRGAILGAAAT